MSDITHTSQSAAGTYEEWRVTGQPEHGYPPYEFVWSPLLNPHLGSNPESSARRFIEMVKSAPDQNGGVRSPWIDGPHLSKRTVVIGEWLGINPEET